MPFKDPIKAREYSRERMKAIYLANPEEFKSRYVAWTRTLEGWGTSLLKNFRAYASTRGISPPAFGKAELFAAVADWDGSCQCCNRQGLTLCFQLGHTTKTGAHVDHCHRTGKLGGFLCPRCNSGLGHFENEQSQTNFKAYISKFR